MSGAVCNNAGGMVFEVSDMDRVKRMLCLGSEGTYYAKAADVSADNMGVVRRLLADGRGVEVVALVRSLSVEGRTHKQDGLLTVLAMCSVHEHAATRFAAFSSLADVCRVPTHLFRFVELAQAFAGSGRTGWGRARRRAVSQWYTGRNARELAMSVTKYKNREGWSHRDLLRLCHAKPGKDGVSVVLAYIAKGLEHAKQAMQVSDATSEGSASAAMHLLEAAEEAGRSTDERRVCDLIRTHGLVREHVATGLLNSVLVWDALLQKMPMTAMVRNLGKMSSIGLLVAGSPAEALVVERLTSEAALHRARVHPLSLLIAMKTYSAGRGDRGSLSWCVSHEVVGALDRAFYLAFKTIVPTGKSFLLALDVSGSMGISCAGQPKLSCREATAVLAMSVARVEKQYHCMAFSTKFMPLAITPEMSLDQVLQRTDRLPFGGTDCAVPMQWALRNNVDVDTFVVFTDSETWFGNELPVQALRRYRSEINPNARLAVVAMASTGFSIADPTDGGMLDIAGFDAALPAVLSDFSSGKV